MESKELLLIIEAISNEKNISQEDVIKSLEEAITIATKKKDNIHVRVEINRKTFQFDTFRRWLVVADGETFIESAETEFDPELHIYQTETDKLDIDSYLEKPIDSLEFSRISTQIIKQVIIQKVYEKERSGIVDNFINRVGDIVSVTVKRIDRGNAYVDIDGVEGMISRFDLIANESIRKNDRLKACIREVKPATRGAQIFLSRTSTEMMIKLFEMEVPEIDDGVIEIKSGAREPGLRAKLAVKAKDKRIDPIGSCIGMRGSRVQAVSNQLNGERVDIILWDEDPAKFVINAIAPAEVKSIVVDEDKSSMDIIVTDENLALAIGRSGQNIKLASRLTGWKLNIMSLNDADELQNKEIEKKGEKLSEKLGIDAEVVNILIEEGYTNLEEIADADAKNLTKIKEFDKNMVEELQERAQDAQLVKAIEDSQTLKDLLKIENIDENLANLLINSDINDLEDLANLSVDEFLEIKKIDKDKASKIIMSAREKQGWFK